MPNTPDIPADLLRHVTDSGGAKITFVIGAGCSVEDTGLPLSRELSRQVHRRLIKQKVLTTPCSNPEDLSAVADAVYKETGQQKPLVDRMDIHRFQNVQPNIGHNIAAALMLESVITSVLTLNYDDAMSGALRDVDVSSQITEIRGPEVHDRMSSQNLIYLHRKADADPEDLILRTVDIKEEWEDGWEEIISHSFLAYPATIFAGLGSPTGVLTETVKKIREAVGERTEFFQIDYNEYDGGNGKSPFTDSLEIDEEQFVQAEWCAFMKELATHVQDEHSQRILSACGEISLQVTDDKWEELRDRANDLLQRKNYDLLEMGAFRAQWYLDTGTNYAAFNASDKTSKWIAQLVMAICLIEQYFGVSATFLQDGLILFENSNEAKTFGRLVHGRGDIGWLELEEKIRERDDRSDLGRIHTPAFVLGGGLQGARTQLATPDDIVDRKAGDDRDIMNMGSDLLQMDAYTLDQEINQLSELFQPS